MDAGMGTFEKIGLQAQITHLEAENANKDKKIERLEKQLKELEGATLPTVAMLMVGGMTGDHEAGSKALSKLIKNVTDYVEKHQ